MIGFDEFSFLKARKKYDNGDSMWSSGSTPEFQKPTKQVPN